VSALIVAASGSALVEQIGAYAGLASTLALAVLALLYFSQAREVRRLREWAGREPERAVELAQRVQTDPQRRVVAQPMQPATPAAQQQATAALYASVGATPPGVSPAGSLARPAATPAAGLLPAPGAAPQPAVPGAANPVAAPGLGAAAAGAAAAGAAAASGAAAAPPVPGAPAAPGAATTPTPTPTPTPSPGLGGPAAGTPLGQSPPASAAAQRTAAAQRSASLSAYANGSTGQDTRESAAARPEPLSSGDDDEGGITRGRIAAYAGGAVAAVALAIVLVLVLTGGDETQPPNDFGNTPTQAADAPASGAAGAGSGAGSGSGSSASGGLTAAKRRATQVAVLNGTTQAGLGRNVGDKIEKERFTIATVGTNSDQQIPATIISYTAGNETAAKAVAKIVGVGTSSVQPADVNATVAADADVVVTVGLDLSG